MNKTNIPKSSPFFTPVDISSSFNRDSESLTHGECSEELCNCKEKIPSGVRDMRGIPFVFGQKGNGKNNILLLKENIVTFVPDKPLVGYKYLIFAHNADFKKSDVGRDGIIHPMMGNPRLGEEVCEYRLVFDDGMVHGVKISRRFNINDFYINWGAGAFEAVPCIKPRSIMTNTENFVRGRMPETPWGESQQRVISGRDTYFTWLYAMENPYPDKKIVSISFIPVDGMVLISGITGCSLNSNPLRWESRKKAIITLPDGVKVDKYGDYNNIDIDLGQIISVQPRLDYEKDSWESGYNNKQPESSESSVIVEYTAHPSAFVYLGENGEVSFPVSKLQQEVDNIKGFAMCRIPEADKRVTIKVKDKKTGKIEPVKIHIHGTSGEYLPPVNRHRIPNRYWFEDYSADYVHGSHLCTYIDGEAEYKLPLGDVYVEVSKGFEIKPVRKKYHVTENTDEIVIELEHVLPWRKNGWVTADTHVHFLSPHTALLEGEAEGVNVVNLLASQWGELFTNIGDFDGKTTLGSQESGGTGEFLVRVGTENRQQILGHISLLGYDGRMILPLTTGGPDESAFGDPIEETLCGWAKRCRDQNGVVVLPHHPYPKAESAAAIVSGMVDGIEMTSGGDLYSGINPYSLSDWYRYLNCGYNIPAVGGTDKMSANTAVGTIRTYAKIENKPFTYENWKEAVRKGCTFATYGPLLELKVEGEEMGGKLELSRTGGTLQVEWKVSSVTIPVTRIELVVNGETREVCSVDSAKGEYSGSLPVKVEQNCWIALRVRGRQPGKAEMIAAHSSAVMVNIPGESCFNKVDAMTILEQIEGATAYMKTIATKAEERVYKELLMTLTSAHRALHNRMHRIGIYHNHTVVDEHHK